MFFEYLKKHRKAVAIKFGVSLASVCLAFLTIIVGILSNPLLQAGLLAFIMLLTPTGFGFLIFGLLLVASLLCTALWAGVEYYRMNELDHKYEHHLNEGQISDLLDKKETSEHHVTEQSMILLKSEEDLRLSDGEEEIEVDDPLESFEQQAKKIIETIDATLLQPQANQQATLESQLNAFKKRYYRLARIYHPDLESDENEKALKSSQFQKLSGIYEQVQNKCNQLKENIEQRLSPSATTQAYQEQNELLHKTGDLLQEHNELLRETIVELKEDNELLKSYLAMFERQAAYNRKLDEEIENLKIELAIQQRKFEENEQKFKDNIKNNREYFDNKLNHASQEFEEKLQHLEQQTLPILNREKNDNQIIPDTSDSETNTRLCILL